MPWATEQNAGYITSYAVGPVMLAIPALGSNPTAAPIAAGQSWQSGPLASDGYKDIAIGVTSSQAGQIIVQRYLDSACTVTQGAPISQALVAATPATVNCVDGMPYAAFTVRINNTGGAPATLTNFAILLAAD